MVGPGVTKLDWWGMQAAEKKALAKREQGAEHHTSKPSCIKSFAKTTILLVVRGRGEQTR